MEAEDKVCGEEPPTNVDVSTEGDDLGPTTTTGPGERPAARVAEGEPGGVNTVAVGVLLCGESCVRVLPPRAPGENTGTPPIVFVEGDEDW